MRPTARVQRGRRVAAWLVTGPVGFFLAGAIDWFALAGRYLYARARGRDPWQSG